MKNKTLRVLVLVAAIALASVVLAGCLPGDRIPGSSKPAGFLWGIWHGWIAPLSLIGEIFNRNIRIYEPVNTGFWYDLGYYMAIISGFGSLSFARRKRNSRRD